MLVNKSLTYYPTTPNTGVVGIYDAIIKITKSYDCLHYRKRFLIMPILKLPIEDTKDSIMRPIMTDITRQLNIKMGFDPDTPIFYPDEAGVMMQHNSKIQKDNDFGSKFAGNELISIEVDEVFVDSLRETKVLMPEHMSIFRDDKLGIIMKPVYMPCILNISYKYRCKDRSQAEMWRNKMRSKMSYYGDLNHHHLKYHYLIPEIHLAVLEELHRLRELKDGYNDTFAQYLSDRINTHGSVRLTKLSNFNGHRQRLAIAENQTRVYGMYQFDVAPDRGQREDEISTWTSTFNYRVQYSRPTELILQYPIMVHQSLVPDPFIPSRDDTMYEEGIGKERHFSLSGFYMECFSSQYERRIRAKDNGIQLPDFDEFSPSDIVPGTRRIFDALLSLDTDKPDKLANLLEIEDVSFGEEMIEFMKGEAPYMKHRGRSVLHTTLYNQWGLLHHRYHEVTNNLDVNSILDLSLRNCYHLRLSIFEDWFLIDGNAIDRLRKHPKIVKDLLEYLGFDFNKILEALKNLREKYHHINTPNSLRGLDGPIWRNEHGKLVKPPGLDFDEWEKWLKNKEIPEYYMWNLISLITGKQGIKARMFTAQTFFVEGHRREDEHNGSINYY